MGERRAFSIARSRLRVARPATAAVVVTVLAACGGEPEEGRPVVTRVDTTNGVVRIHHSGEAPVLGTEEALTLGAVGAAMGRASPEEFGRVVKVLADGGGTIYVADAMSAQIRVFSADGDHVRTLGRKGAGPGELEALSAAAWLGDTLVVADPGNARLTLLSRDGHHRGQWPWAALTGPVDWLPRGGPGEVYAVVIRQSADAGRPGAELVWARFTAAGATDTVLIPRLAEPVPGSFERCRSGDGSLGFFTNPYAMELLATPAPGGERAVARTDAYRIAFLSAAGDTVWIITREIEPTPVPDLRWSEIQEEYDAWKAERRSAECQGGVARPEHMPVLRALSFSHDGRLLVEHRTPTGPALDVFERDGSWEGTVSLPPRDESVPPFFRDGRIYLVTRDSLDVQRVRVLEVQ